MCLFLHNIIDISVSYQVSTDRATYIDAVILCRDKGGDIAMPKSDAENQQILTAYEKQVIRAVYWIGIQVIYRLQCN